MSQLTTLLSKMGPVTKQVLGTYAPFLLKAAGGPFGVMAGTALQAIFGTSDPSQVETAMAGATPDQIVALKKANEDFQAKMRELGISEEELYLKDVEDARSMQTATKDPTVARLAWTVVGGFMVVSLAQLVGLVIYPDAVNKIPPQGWLLIGNISGYLANEAKQAAAFYFGSSAGSQAKDQTLADLAKS